MRTFGAVLLIAGCCMGAGMLGLPLVIASAGFIPSTIAFFVTWAFMAATGLLLLEANLWFGEGVNLMTLAEKTLGKGAKAFVAVTFIFLFYCLLVAYLGAGGDLLAEFSRELLDMSMNPFQGSVILVFLFGGLLYGGTQLVDAANRWMMLGFFISFAGLALLGLFHMESMSFQGGSFSYALAAFPAMIISFGYHNLVPTLTTYLGGDIKKMRFSIVLGSLIPLFCYLLWDGIVLGMLSSHEDLQGAIDSGAMVTRLLKETIGASYIVDLMHLFAFFAIVTSLVGVAMSFVDFLADGMHVEKIGIRKWGLIGLVLLPPCFFSYVYPMIFLNALNYAGAFGAVLLFGIIPVFMVWKGRYVDGKKDLGLVPGGRFSLAAIALFALFVFGMQLKNELGL